jgi:hypothetical protein
LGHVVGVDENIRFGGVVDWNSFLAKSETPGRTTGQDAWRTSVNYEAQFIHAGQTFFFNDGGYTELSANVYYEYITDSLRLNRGDPAAGSGAEPRRRSTRP